MSAHEEQGQPIDPQEIISDRERLAKRYGERAHYWQQRAEKAEAKVREYESAICWDTTCLGCSKLLDSCYAETVRAEKAESKLAAVRELCHNALTRAATQDDVWQEIEDPTPIPGWVTMVRRAIGDE